MALTTESALRKDKRTGYATLEHRHFAKIAAILADTHDLANSHVICRRFATELAKTNPRFDRERFLKACGSS